MAFWKFTPKKLLKIFGKNSRFFSHDTVRDKSLNLRIHSFIWFFPTYAGLEAYLLEINSLTEMQIPDKTIDLKATKKILSEGLKKIVPNDTYLFGATMGTYQFKSKNSYFFFSFIFPAAFIKGCVLSVTMHEIHHGIFNCEKFRNKVLTHNEEERFVTMTEQLQKGVLKVLGVTDASIGRFKK